MSNQPHPIDVHVGQRIKLRRSLKGMSQERLGELLGVTFQQIQKYERGANRLGSSRLYEVAQVLEMPVTWFFEEMEGQPVRPAEMPGLAEPVAAFDHAPGPAGAAVSTEASEPLVRNRQTLELVRAFNRIEDPQVRRRLYELTRTLAAATGRTPD